MTLPSVPTLTHRTRNAHESFPLSRYSLRSHLQASASST